MQEPHYSDNEQIMKNNDDRNSHQEEEKPSNIIGISYEQY